MEQTIKNVTWVQYLLLGLALWFFGGGAITLVAILMIPETKMDRNKSRVFFYAFAAIFIGYGFGNNLALYENAVGVDCVGALGCIKGGLLGN